MMKRPQLTVPLVVVLCTIAAMLNWLFIELLRRDNEFSNSALYRELWHPMYANARSVLLAPGFLIVDMICLGYALWWAFRPRKQPVNEYTKLGVVAFSLLNIYAVVLLYFVRF